MSILAHGIANLSTTYRPLNFGPVGHKGDPGPLCQDCHRTEADCAYLRCACCPTCTHDYGDWVIAAQKAYARRAA